MQRGGFDIIPIKDSDFKYTIDPDRILWTKNVFPIAEYIIQAIQNIPWSSYKFEGPSQFWKVTGAGSPESEDLDIQTITDSSPLYYYFGGSVYEIMNKLYTRSEMPNLRSYVDPTGDLDVMLILPKILLPEGKSSKDYFAYFFRQLPFVPNGRAPVSPLQIGVASANGIQHNNTNQTNRRILPPTAEPPELFGCPANVFTGNNATQENVRRDPRRYSVLVEHYTDWIMDKFTENLKGYARGGLLDAIFGNTVKFNLENDAEGKYADRIICIGNVKFVRSFLPYMNLIKLQLIAKFKGMGRSDHICEFLLQIPSNIRSASSLHSYETIEHKYQVLKGFPLTNFGELVRGNIDSLINRYSLYNGELRHKFYNHVGRMQYLHEFIKKNVNPYYGGTTTKIRLSDEESKSLGTQLGIYCFYIAEHYFAKTLLHFDSKVNASDMTETQRGTHLMRILQEQIGFYPKFLMRRKASGGYVSPFRTIKFEAGQDIPARTPFIMFHLFRMLNFLPRYVLRGIGIREDPVEEIDLVQLFMFLDEVGAVSL